MSIDYSSFAFPKGQIKEKSKPKKMKGKSKKLAKLERQRYSILTDNLEHYYLCEAEYKYIKKDDLHEIFGGRNRRKSMEWGLVVPICRKCHCKLTNNIKEYKKLQKEGKKAFIKKYGKQKFMEEFK